MLIFETAYLIIIIAAILTFMQTDYLNFDERTTLGD